MSSRFYIFLFLFLGSFLISNATHNRAGEISYKRIAPFTKTVGGITVQNYRYLITVIKYTDDGPGIADRCVDTVYFGDGDRGVAPRVNGSTGSCGCGNLNNTPIGCGVVIINDANYKVKMNIYTIEHTYAGPGNYLIRSFDPNRNQGVQNIPNSVNLPFYIESLLIINSFSGANSSPVFSFPPVDKACIGECFEHNPGAYDPDKDDSLSFEISASRQANGFTVTGYSFPDYGAGGHYGIDARTGLLSWCTPVNTGEYNLAFIVKEWRKNTSGVYQLIGYILRDMQVIVGDCKQNHPPDVQVPQDTCVEAGSIIEKDIFITDPDTSQIVKVEGGGGPFSGPLPYATLSNVSSIGPIGSAGFKARFRWQTTCDHIRRQSYQSTFKATDNGSPTKLVTFKSFNIRVLPPAVKNVTAFPVGSAIKITWDLSTCSTTNNPISGYKIYRKNDCNTFTYSPCQSGVPSSTGYTLVGDTNNAANSFVDNNNGDGLVVGQNYSYMVVAVYNDGTESFGSAAICAELKRDVPVLLNVDVMSTSANTGSVFIRWSRPLTTPGNLNLSDYPGPYEFNLKHRAGNTGNFTTVFKSANANFFALDTSFVHTDLKTVSDQEQYIIEFISGTVTVGSSQIATSVFLSTVPADRQITLSWNSKTPWNNKKYYIMRKDPASSTYSQVATTTLTTYSDTFNIANRNTYCYYVVSEGEYSDSAIYKPLINRSQESCAKAIDLTNPCTPTLQIEADCPTGYVKVMWNNVRPICSDDVVRYILSYKPSLTDEYTTVETDTTFFEYHGLTLISGCYAIQSVDSSGNISSKSADFCIDNCPEFELPNIFSPNGDNNNDHFMAIKVRQIREINLNVFDRWGNLVYHTKDPYFKWNGVSIITNLAVSEGVFFYTCEVFEPRLKGTVKRTLKGPVHIVR
jgi:gliding motility-associated-like protein